MIGRCGGSLSLGGTKSGFFEVPYNRYYETFDKYKEACRAFLDRLVVYVPQLRTLLTENFEIVCN
jgi:hypothetical protein